MVVEVTMPQLGESVTEGTIGAWLKREGDWIRRDEPLVEVITDKVNAEVPSPVEGTLTRILVQEGETVPVGRPIAIIEAPGVGVANGTGASQPEQVAAGVAAPAAVPDGERRRYSPVVRRLAREHQLDLSSVKGTGYGGRVTKRDVLAHLNRLQSAAPAPEAPAKKSSTFEPVGILRRTIAERMAQAWREIPHAWTMVEADVTSLVRFRERVKDEFLRREGVPLTYVPFWIKAVVQCLREEPLLNATWQDGKIQVHRHINVGLAVGVENGLVVPVIRDADRHTIASLAREVHRLVQAARNGTLSVEDVQGGTITLNNTGALGVILSKSIVNPPQTAICNMEAIVRRPVVVGDAIAIRSMVNLTISFDHRVVDGAPVGRFMRALKQRMEAYGDDTSLY